MPQDCIDPLMISSQLYTALESAGMPRSRSERNSSAHCREVRWRYGSQRHS